MNNWKNFTLFIWFFSVISVISVVNPLSGQDKKDAPKVLLAEPLGVPVDKPTKVTLRGLKLDAATEVRWADPKVTAMVKILNKGKAAVPDKMDAARVGDTQVEVEVTLTAEMLAAPSLVVKTPGGDTNAQPLLVETETAVIAKKEPNGGFRQAQPLTLPQVVEGVISQTQDVDVFRVEGKAGQSLSAEVLASRFGSMLDSTLTLYDADGRQLAWDDDSAGHDSTLKFVLPRDGVYYLGLIDAHDSGSALHVYRLRVRLTTP
jgi:hypothetical protein